MEKILSVIIPSYNVEQFLKKTVESFLVPDILADIEILIINDGSADGTEEIGRTYERLCPDTVRVVTKENGGHGSTINRGIREACGKYFKVVDGDDWVDTEQFVSFVRQLKTVDADFVVTKYFMYNNRTGEMSTADFPGLKEIVQIPENQVAMFEDLASACQIPMHALTVRTSILKDNHICLDEHCFYVDVEYILYPIPFVRTVAYIDCTVYVYRVAQEEQSVSYRGFQRHIQNHIDVICHLARFLRNYAQENPQEKLRYKYIERRISDMICSQLMIFFTYPASSKVQREQFVKFDRALYELNPSLYKVSGKSSRFLWCLRALRFRCYPLVMWLGQKRFKIKGDFYA